MTTTPILTGQDIGRAHYATRALLEASLTDTGLAFPEWITVNMVATLGPSADESTTVTRVADGLKIDVTDARAALDAVIGAGLVEREAPGSVSLTTAGNELFTQVTAKTAVITQRLYGDLPIDDLAAAQRVLATVTDRANDLLSI